MARLVTLICAALSVTVPLAAARPGHKRAPQPPQPPCRFALKWSQDDVLHRTQDFVSDMLYWEGKFHQNGVGYNTLNGMTYDGTELDLETGKPNHIHGFSAASKEALQFMLYARVIDGSKDAARFLTPDDPKAAPRLATSVLKTKLDTYKRFNETFPGFGGHLPWFNNTARDISPTWDWNNRVPGLDNGLVGSHQESFHDIFAHQRSQRTRLGNLRLH